MTRMEHGHTFDYQPGRPWATCSRCTFDVRLDTMKLEWSGLRVCPECYDPRPDTMIPPVVYPEGQPHPDAQPQLPDAFITTQITPEEL